MNKLIDQVEGNVGAPFKALIAASSVVVVVLAVAGYSYRWTFYYNFGLHSLVLSTPLSSIPLYSFELIRDSDSLIDLVRFGLIYLLPFHVLLLVLAWARNAGWPAAQSIGRAAQRLLALQYPFVVEAITAAIVVVIAFKVGGEAGYRSYKASAIEETSRLPRVSLIFAADAPSNMTAIACDTRPLLERIPMPSPAFIGSLDHVSALTAGGTCSADGESWRLLLRDDKFVYIFRTVTDARYRPATLILPNTGNTVVVLQ